MKSKILFSTGAFGILLMMAGQQSFAINDTFVKLAVINIEVNSSIFSVIFTRGSITTLLLGVYLIFIEKKNLISILSIKKFHIRGTSSFNLDVHSSEPKNFVEQINLPVRPLDSFKLHPSFIKIDAEGAEYEILCKSLKTIRKFKPVIHCEVTRKKSDIFNLLKKNNYNLFTISYDNISPLKIKDFRGDLLAINKNTNYIKKLNKN